MSLERSDFAGFFAALNEGYTPFAWQERLLDHVLDTGRWPDQLVAPTGAGKTSVIDIHVFALALAACHGGPRLPRRLSMIVDRRVLVDDQHEHALSISRRLVDSSDDGVLHAVAEQLWRLRRPFDPSSANLGVDVSPLEVAMLRGGRPASRAWLSQPGAAAVISATPDMWGSRLLFRGYGASRTSWPRAAGLLAFDSVAVVDEAHLAQQLLVTARRVSYLATVATKSHGVPALQVVETSATPREREGLPAGSRVGVEPSDLRVDSVLLARMERPKPLRLAPVPGWPGARGADRRRVDGSVVDAVVQLLEEVRTLSPAGAPSTVGCFVNSVSRAVTVADALRQHHHSGRSLRVVLVCGQVRPFDLARLAERHPGLLTPAGSADVDVIVTTQSLEVGVDLDLAGTVTELAPGSALAQRSGRVNRRGLRERGPVTVVVPDGNVPDDARSGPYETDDLTAALTFVRHRAEDPRGLAPLALTEPANRPPSPQSQRLLHQRPELMDAWHWARTSDRMAAEPELDLWLAEDFDDDTSVGLVVRDDVPRDGADAVRLVAAVKPRPHEVFSVPYRSASAALAWDRAQADSAEASPAVVVRGDDVALLTWRPALESDGEERPVMRPGDVVVVDSGARLFTLSGSAEDRVDSPVVVVPPETETSGRFTADDVLEATAELSTWSPVGNIVLRLDRRDDDVGDLLDSLGAIEVEQDLTGLALDLRRRELLRTWLDNHETTSMRLAAGRFLADASSRRTARQCEVVVQRALDPVEDDAEPTIVRVVLVDRRRVDPDDGIRQVWSGPTTSDDPVTLQAHQDAVARRVEVIGHSLGVAEGFIEALSLAGAHHDDGKCDDRFQVRLGGSGSVVLAKSPPRTTIEQMRRRQARDGLPSGWRHEQRSVAASWGVLNAYPGTDPLLVARLVGTTHGHGRPGFPHTTKALLRAEAEPTELREFASQLFDDGLWDDLIESTHRTYGVWGCAYLEALLRAADGQVSEEGS